MLYIFPGFPQSGLNAGGLQHCVEEIEELAILEHDPAVQYRKEGVFAPGEADELLYPVEGQISDLCLRDGITWDWFPENWSFGNGVTVHKTSASVEHKKVVHGTDLNLEEFLSRYRPSQLPDRELDNMLIRHEGWEKYEARWLPGTCPQKKHIVYLTWLVTTHRLPEFAYRRIEQIIGDPNSVLSALDRYDEQHFSKTYTWRGKEKSKQEILDALPAG
jgi:hypothetical protein